MKRFTLLLIIAILTVLSVSPAFAGGGNGGVVVQENDTYVVNSDLVVFESVDRLQFADPLVANTGIEILTIVTRDVDSLKWVEISDGTDDFWVKEIDLIQALAPANQQGQVTATPQGNTGAPATQVPAVITGQQVPGSGNPVGFNDPLCTNAASSMSSSFADAPLNTTIFHNAISTVSTTNCSVLYTYSAQQASVDVSLIDGQVAICWGNGSVQYARANGAARTHTFQSCDAVRIMPNVQSLLDLWLAFLRQSYPATFDAAVIER